METEAKANSTIATQNNSHSSIVLRGVRLQWHGSVVNFVAADTSNLRYALRHFTHRQFCQRGRAARIVAEQFQKLTPLQFSHLHQNKGHAVHVPTFLCHTTHGSQFVRDDFIGYLLWNSQPHFLLEAPFSNLNNMAKRGTFNSTQALELILQEGSDDKTEVDHYESSNESVEDEDFFGQRSWNRRQPRLFERWRRGNQQWNPAWYYWCRF